METYSDLQLNRFYLIKESEMEAIILVQPLMETDNCLLLINLDEYENTFWKKKTDELFELVDELSDEQLAEYEILFEDEEDDDEFDD